MRGGIEEFGGFMFSLFHLPTSLLVAYLFQALAIEGRLADIFFVGMVIVLQFTLLLGIAYLFVVTLRRRGK